jgi:hypothetical protein
LRFTVFSLVKLSLSISSNLNLMNLAFACSLGMRTFSMALDLRFVFSISRSSFLSAVSFSAMSMTSLWTSSKDFIA